MKKNLLFLVCRGWISTQLISLYKDPVINQPVFHGSCHVSVFCSLPQQFEVSTVLTPPKKMAVWNPPTSFLSSDIAWRKFSELLGQCLFSSEKISKCLKLLNLMGLRHGWMTTCGPEFKSRTLKNLVQKNNDTAGMFIAFMSVRVIFCFEGYPNDLRTGSSDETLN